MMKRMRLATTDDAVGGGDTLAISRCGATHGISGAAVRDHGGGADLISDLPETLRLHILTFLPLASAIRTSALSTRWLNLWRCRWPEPANLEFIALTVSPDLFVGHVNNQIQLHPPPRNIDTLRIAFHPRSVHLPDISNWIAYAAECSVIDLLLDLTSPGAAADTNPPEFPLNRQFRSLVRLRLGGCSLSKPDIKFSCLRTLEVVCLYKVHIVHQALSVFVYECPGIRTLDMRCCTGFEGIKVVGGHLSLTTLTVLDCPQASRIELSTLKLRSLRLRGEFLTTRFWHLDAIEEACINWGIGKPARLPVIKRDWVESFAGLTAVSVLTLCSLTLQFITHFNISMAFSNLRELQLMIHMLMDENRTDIFGFFKLCSCPCLEKVFIELPTSMGYSTPKKSEDGPLMVFENLKVVRMNNFNGYNNDMWLAGFFLKRAINLEHMILVPARDFKDAAGSRLQSRGSDRDNWPSLHWVALYCYGRRICSSWWQDEYDIHDACNSCKKRSSHLESGVSCNFQHLRTMKYVSLAKPTNRRLFERIHPRRKKSHIWPIKTLRGKPSVGPL